MDIVDTRVIEIALSKVEGVNFEKFAQEFFASSIGVDYVPMGGFHDGGADGVIDDRIFEAGGTQKFMQASVTVEPKTKIRKTLKRLREFDRDPKSLIYATNQKLTLIDKIQDELSDELDCRIVIRDGYYFQSHINNTPGALQAYKTYVADAASFLEGIGTGYVPNTIQGLPAKTLFVFLGQELECQRGKTELLETVTDSLILWSLEGTDPDKGKFLSLSNIETRVIETLPSAKTFFRGIVKHRINALTTKGNGGRKVNYHRKEKGYCLPYETRKMIHDENVKDEALKQDVSNIFRNRAAQNTSLATNNTKIIEQCVEICHNVIHRSFHAQGLEIVLFLERAEGSDSDLPLIKDFLGREIEDQGLVGKNAELIFQTCSSILRGAYYNSSEVERRYFRKLSRTYILLFMLKNEPRILEYFRRMTSNFNLYIGADLIVEALSEQMLVKEDQKTKNTLKLLKTAGSKLALTEKTLDEVWNHLKITHFEFVNNYENIQNYIDLTLASHIDRILIRAYFYAKLKPVSKNNSLSGWQTYLGKFLTVNRITKPSSRDELREYLINEFGFYYENEAEMLSGVNKTDLNQLTSDIKNNRNRIDRDNASEEILSRNAALTILRIFQKRRVDSERSGGNPYGFKTWWLTQQTRVQSATRSLVSKEGARYMMRPEFLIHYLASIPSAKSVQSSYDKIFPSMLGVKLGNRMDEDAFKKIISKAKEVYDEIDDSRAKVLLAEASTQLQSDFQKQYEEN